MKNNLFMIIGLLGIITVGNILCPTARGEISAANVNAQVNRIQNSSTAFNQGNRLSITSGEVSQQQSAFNKPSRQAGVLRKSFSAIGNFFKHPLDTIKTWQQERVQRRNSGFALNPVFSEPKTITQSNRNASSGNRSGTGIRTFLNRFKKQPPQHSSNFSNKNNNNNSTNIASEYALTLGSKPQERRAAVGAKYGYTGSNSSRGSNINNLQESSGSLANTGLNFAEATQNLLNSTKAPF